MTARHLRALRGVAAASIATLIAATAHTLAGGGAPHPALVAGVMVLAAPGGVALVGRRLAAWRVAAAVLASQLLFHVAFAVTAGADPAAVHTSHAHHVDALSGNGTGLVLPDAPMIVAHVVAAAATVVVLHQGERMLRALGRGIRSLFARAQDVVAPPARRRAVATPIGPVRAHARVELSGLSRRGPPLFA